MINENKNKQPLWIKVVIGILLLIAFTISGIYIFIDIKLNKINQIEDIEAVSPEEEYFETENNSEGYKLGNSAENSVIIWPEDGNVKKEKEIINILLIGQDKWPNEPRARSDSMMIVTINKKNKTLKLTSIMRDLYVQIPEYSDNRINAAYAFGGVKLLNATIEKNFQIHIDGNMEVDFGRFEQIIDKIGGIDITINEQEAYYLSSQGFESLAHGLVHMDGELALAYSRIRYVGNSDYERTDRQKRVLITIFNNTKDLGISKILEMVDELLPLVNTDLSHGQIISLSTWISLMDIKNVGTYRIPVDNSFSSRRIRGMSVLVPDLSKNREALKNIIYGN